MGLSCPGLDNIQVVHGTQGTTYLGGEDELTIVGP